jgi:lysophospholipase L1-like esterase
LKTIIVAALGDSITAGTPAWDPDPAVRARLGALNEASQWTYWAARENPALEFRNHGVDLERTDQIRERLSAAVQGADVLVVQGGINDVVQQRDPEATIDDLRAMVADAKRAGLRVLLTDVLPWNNGYPERFDTILTLNAAIAELARDEAVLLLPFYATLDDPDRPGRMRAEWTSDGNHPSVEGHRLLGMAVQRALGGMV